MNIETPADLYTLQADYFKALAHPIRLQILAILRQGEACVCHLEVLLQKRQAYISQQLAILKKAGLLVERKEGLFVYYSLADSHPATLLDFSQTFLHLQSAEPKSISTAAVLESGRCSCPVCLRTG
jgi:ArsR family transcriptional regulator